MYLRRPIQYQRGKRYSDLGVTSRKKIRYSLPRGRATFNDNDIDALFNDIVNGPIGPSGTKQFRLNAEQIQWIKDFAEEDAEHAYNVKESSKMRAKRQKVLVPPR